MGLGDVLAGGVAVPGEEEKASTGLGTWHPLLLPLLDGVYWEVQHLQ